MMVFALATVQLDGAPTPIIRVGDTCYRLDAVVADILAGAPHRGLLNVFDRWDTSEDKLIAAADDIVKGRSSAKAIEKTLTPDDFLAPLLYPNKVVCMGANYYEHMHSDAGITDYNRANAVPTIFIKSPSNTLVGSGKSVRYPSQSSQFDWEIELAMVIGRRARRLPASEARSVIAAFTVAIDLSARDYQFHPKHPFKFDCFGGKTFDDSCPLGPWLIPARFVDDKNLRLHLQLNGRTKQDANTSDMIWSVEEQIEAITDHITLEPGDVVLTGTPAGVGLKNGTYMNVGDRLRAEIEGLAVWRSRSAAIRINRFMQVRVGCLPMLDETQVELLEQRRCSAMISGDVEALGDLLHESLVWTHSSARKDSKASYIAGFGTTGPKYVAIDREGVGIRVFDDTAVVTGVQKMRCIIEGSERSLVNSFAAVWCVVDGRPQIVAWQSTPVPQ